MPAVAEFGSPERAVEERRIRGRLYNVAFNVAAERDIPPRNQVIILDEPTGKRYTALFSVRVASKHGFDQIGINLDSPHIMPPEQTLERMAGILLIANPSNALICGADVIKQFPEGSLTEVDKGHYQFKNAKGAILDIYTPKEEQNYIKTIPGEGI